VEAEMAKDYSERTKALDDIFQRLMVSSGITPANSDTVQVLKGNQREDWAFQKQGEGQWGEGVNVTPFQYRSPAEQKILGDMFDKLYGHGAEYEKAGASKDYADAAMAEAGVKGGYLNIEKKVAEMAMDDRKKKKALENPAAAPTPPPGYVPQPPPVVTGRGGGVAFANPAYRPNVTGASGGVAPTSNTTEDYWKRLQSLRPKQ
jgi:hypothetical protein